MVPLMATAAAMSSGVSGGSGTTNSSGTAVSSAYARRGDQSASPACPPGQVSAGADRDDGTAASVPGNSGSVTG